MAKVQQGSGQWESPQVEPKQLRTPVKGGKMPSQHDVIESANARGQMRHDMKGQQLADVGVLPDSDRIVNDERVGIHNHDYLVKKNLEFGVTANFNSLPPGMDIEDQENCDIRRMEMKAYEGGLGYPGDGWNDNPRGYEKDMGRPSMTNYRGGKAT
jgi:hypothetical protein